MLSSSCCRRNPNPSPSPSPDPDQVRKLELLQEEFEALDRRLVKAEGLRTAKEEMLRDSQAELYKELTLT